MDTLLDDSKSAAARPLFLVTEAELETWLGSQPAATVDWLRAHDFRGERLRVIGLPGADGRLAGAVAGLGKLSSLDALGVHGFAALPERLPPGDWVLQASLGQPAAAHAAVGWQLGSYRFRRYRELPERATPCRLVTPPGVDPVAARRMASADALVRDLVNTPASDLGPEALSDAARSVASECGAEFREVVGKALLDENLPAIHAVGRAGPQAPRLLDLRWGSEPAPRLTLVGKGVCFDTGGLDLKPSQSMALMKKDMGGAATALGLAWLVMQARLPVRLRLLIPAVENSVSAESYRPGDVLQTRKGLTVEVGNTDAEGRLILADALVLADEERPELLIDLATLTGAARVALGPELPAVFTADDSLASELARCGVLESDPSWRLPLWTPYDEDLSSKVADLNNIAAHPMAGAILAALFLQRFVSPQTRWLHADLYAWNARERPGRPVGAEAQLLRCLFRLLAERFGGMRDAGR